jgi:integrase
MQIRPAVSLYHDTRSELKNGKFPVKVRVTFQIKSTYKQIYFKTGISLSEKEFKTCMSALPGNFKETRKILAKREAFIDKQIEDRPNITPEVLTSIIKGKTVIKLDVGITLDVATLFDNLIREYYANEQISTGDGYKYAKKRFLKYSGPGLMLDEIDARWLEDFEKWTLSAVPKNNLTTTGMYMRNLRHLCNKAVEDGIIPVEKYPFGGKAGYAIRGQETVKDVINEAGRTKVLGEVINKDQEKRALAYWLFSYYCLGMNFTDMAYLEPGQIKQDKIVYVRRKTMRTVKTVKEMIVPLRPEVKEILKEYGGNQPYVFGIINDTMDAREKHTKILQWITTTNKWMNKITTRAGIDHKVNTYGARHAVGRQWIEKGVHLQYIQELYGHTTIQTTQVYTKGMNIDKAKGFTDLL